VLPQPQGAHPQLGRAEDAGVPAGPRLVASG
jgi:hypothetical protein